jgi:hypothetical protein
VSGAFPGARRGVAWSRVPRRCAGLLEWEAQRAAVLAARCPSRRGPGARDVASPLCGDALSILWPALRSALAELK